MYLTYIPTNRVLQIELHSYMSDRLQMENRVLLLDSQTILLYYFLSFINQILGQIQFNDLSVYYI